MKQIFAGTLLLTALTAGSSLYAQQGKEEKVEEIVVQGKPGNIKKSKTEEIVIRRKGEKDVNITVEIKGDKVMVNGKPLAEFKDDAVTINKRTMSIIGQNMRLPRIAEGYKKGEDNYDFDFDFDFDGPMQFWNDGDGKEEKTTFLGVTTEKVDGGAKITQVKKESAADKAGLKEGDVITKVGTTSIEDPEDLSAAIKSRKPKEEVTIAYRREGKERSAKATLGETVQKNVRVFTTSPRMRSGELMEIPNLRGGVTIPRSPRSPYFNFEDYGDNMMSFYGGRPKLGLKIQDVEDGDGVKVIEVEEGSAAEKAGLKKDDIIIEIGGKKVKNTDEAREQMVPEPDKTAYSMKAKRNGSEMSFEVKVPKKIKTASF